MLPDFPKVRAHAQGIMMKWLHARCRARSGVLARLPEHLLHEGNAVELHRHDGTVQVITLQKTMSALTLERESFKQGGLSAVVEAMEKTARDMADKQTRSFLHDLNRICEETGQVKDAQGRPLSYDLIMDLLETMDIDFDEKNQPILPTLLMGRETIEKLKRLEMTDAEQTRFKGLIERKLIDYRYGEGRRKLVD
jgi:hypothetical protein